MGIKEDSSEESEWETDEEEEDIVDEDEGESEAVIEEGCPVKPGDLLVAPTAALDEQSLGRPITRRWCTLTGKCFNNRAAPSQL